MQLNAIVECGSFALAAQQMALTQPALTRNMKLLEDRVGARLLERGRHGARPTELGRLLSAKGKALRDVLDCAGSTASQIRSGELGRLRIGTTFGVATDLLALPLKHFLAQFPRISIKTSVGPLPMLLESLSRGELDVVIGGMQLMAADSGIHFEPLADNRLVVLARPRHPLVRDGVTATAAGLRSARWIVRPSVDPLQLEIASAMTAMGVTHDAVALETSNMQLATRLLQETDLLMLEPYVSARSQLDASSLAEVRVDVRLAIRPIGVACHNDRMIGPTCRAFMQILKQWAEATFPAGASSRHRAAR
jgi:DNA-binding transcriptional LysR family regulator